ncbi:hypothetical protein SAMN04487980_1002384 [Streptomyces sp. cf124]|nr:hypothetical protein SAMN04487980_1002384 [Streptomyces sp. cf124]
MPHRSDLQRETDRFTMTETVRFSVSWVARIASDIDIFNNVGVLLPALRARLEQRTPVSWD